MKIKIGTSVIAKILAVVYIVLISIFSLDTPFGIGFLIHLIPSVIFILVLIIAWKSSTIGGILFIFAGLGTILVWNTYRELFTLFIISIVPILIGVLFFFSKNPKH